MEAVSCDLRLAGNGFVLRHSRQQLSTVIGEDLSHKRTKIFLLVQNIRHANNGFQIPLVRRLTRGMSEKPYTQ
jgi:hypothetical protein